MSEPRLSPRVPVPHHPPVTDTSRPWEAIVARRELAVLLIRHGRTAFNAEHRFCGGRSDPPLDARGREQAAALGERFAGVAARVFSSSQLRARETAAALAEPTALEDLRELDQGGLEGREIHPALVEHAGFFRAWKRDPSHVPVPGGGESMGALADRVERGMAEVLAQVGASRRVGRGQVIAVVGHQMAHGAFTCRALARPLRDWQQFALRNATANLLSWNGRTWTLVARNL